MAHMERPGRVDRDIFHIDRGARPHGGRAVILSGGENFLQPVPPEAVGQAEIDEARPGDLDALDRVTIGQPASDQPGDVAGLGAGLFSEHQSDVRGQIAMARIARRLDRDGRRVEPPG